MQANENILRFKWLYLFFSTEYSIKIWYQFSFWKYNRRNRKVFIWNSKKNKTKHMTKRAFVGTFVRLGTIFCYHYTRFINKLVLEMLWNRWTSIDTQNHQKNVVKTTKTSTKQEFKRRNNQERFMRKNYRMIENLSSATKLA